jgi:serine/threonine-protein kinase
VSQAGNRLARWPRISRLLDELLDVDEAARGRKLEQILEREPEIGAQLSRLLTRHTQSEAAQFLEGTVLTTSEQVSLAGRVVGNYTLERLLGTGGMGAVWLARRSDGRYEGWAAVKFLNLSLLGKAGEERFRREGVALARLSHPNIAQLTDAGTDRGQPYLILEYVEGQPIDEWCDGHAASVSDRIRLFREVLAAVAHAHERLILHRDLKPSNILVTAEGRIKLLDFGVAKLLDVPSSQPPTGGGAQRTARAFTPDYAAPEQISGAEVTTATDVYSLGVLLQVLLSGEHPTGRDDNPLERLQAVVERVPLRLSEAALRGSVRAAHLRRSTPARLARELRGDLDNIVAKALKKLPAERYATVVAFGDDLRRYLRHEPVEARPDSATYRMCRFVRRNRAVVAASAAGLVLSVAGIVGIVWQSLEARRERAEAIQRAEQADARDNLFSLVLGGVGEAGRPLTQREILERSAALAERYRHNPDVAIGLLRLIRGEYYTLGDLDRSAAIDRRIIDIAQASADPQHIADAACNAVIGDRRRGEVDLALTRLRVGLAAKARLAQPALGTIVTCARAQADMAFVTGNVDEAIERLTEAMRLVETAGDDTRATYPSLQATYPSLLSWLKAMYWLKGDLAASFAVVKQLQEHYESIGQAGSVNYQSARRAEAELMMAWGEYRDAKTLLEELASHWRGVAGGGATAPVWLDQTLAQMQLRHGQHESARLLLESAAGRARQEGNVDNAVRIDYLLAQAYAALGQVDESERYLVAVETQRRPGVGPDVWWITPATVRAQRALSEDRVREAAQMIEAELRELGYPTAQPSLALAAALRVAAEALTRGGDSRALSLAESAVRVAEHIARDDARSADVGEALLWLARAQQQAGNRTAAAASAHRAERTLELGLGLEWSIAFRAMSGFAQE